MMLVFVYAVVAFVIAVATDPLPGSSVLLTVLEIVMTYHLAKKYYKKKLTIGEIGVVAAFIYVSIEALKLAVSTMLEAAIIIGWIIKPFVAFFFVLFLGWLVNWYLKDFMSKE